MVGDRLDRVVICLLPVEPPVLRDGLLRTIILPVDCLVLVEPLEILGDVRGREIVVRLEVLRLLLELRLDILGLELRLDVIVLERLGVEFRVEALGALLRLEDLGGLDRLTLLVFDLRDDELEAAVVRLLLLLELPLFRELLAAKTGSEANTKIEMQKAKIKEVIPACRDSTILIFNF